MSRESPILVFGAGGQLGSEVLALAAKRERNAIGLQRAEADITDPAAVFSAIETKKPRLILNAAAYTAVDKAESEPEAARAVNVTGAENIAVAAAHFDVPIVHVSTDYVFDGSKTGAYNEQDMIRPLGIYGATKAEGEDKVRAANARHIILRTSWVFSRFGTNFLKTMLRLARERDALRVVADQRGCPTSTLDLAEALFAIDDRLAAQDETARPLWGTYHFAGTGVTTWHAFASTIIEAQAPITGRHPPVEPITTQDYPTPARRPANSELDSSLFISIFGYRAPDWAARTREAVASLHMT
jgi:dTDP-4-dehydrorhamnose reductase